MPRSQWATEMRNEMLEMSAHSIIGMPVRSNLSATFWTALDAALVQAKRINEADTDPLPLNLRLAIWMVGILHAPIWHTPR